MTPVEKQLVALADTVSGVTHAALSTKAMLVTVPDEPLPPGWSLKATSVKFLVPVAYPMARPDCFWADTNLRLANRALPQASRVQQIPGTAQTALWFSWHVQHWDPNRDTLCTFLQVIRTRLKDAK